MQILDVITNQIAEPRKEVSKYAPKTEIFTINPEKIKDVIGKGRILRHCRVGQKAARTSRLFPPLFPQ